MRRLWKVTAATFAGKLYCYFLSSQQCLKQKTISLLYVYKLNNIFGIWDGVFFQINILKTKSGSSTWPMSPDWNLFSSKKKLLEYTLYLRLKTNFEMSLFLQLFLRIYHSRIKNPFLVYWIAEKSKRHKLMSTGNEFDQIWSNK